MKKVFLSLLFASFPLLLLPSEAFPRYDITFYKSAEDSMMVANRERIGFDFTGYAYLGEEKSTGLYLRTGFQAPYSSIINLISFDKTRGSDDDAASEAGSKNEGEEKRRMEWNFAFGIGPAFRSPMGENAIVYAGIGATATANFLSEGSEISKEVAKTDKIVIGADGDAGIRLSLPKRNTSIRIGVHLAFDVIGRMRSRTMDLEGNLLSSRSTFYGYAFSQKSIFQTLRGCGYIRIASTFRSEAKYAYDWSTASREKGKGTTTKRRIK